MQPVTGRPGRARLAGFYRGEIDGEYPGDLRPAHGRHGLAGDRRSREKGGEADRGEDRVPEIDIGRAVPAFQETEAFRRVVLAKQPSR